MLIQNNPFLYRRLAVFIRQSRPLIKCEKILSLHATPRSCLRCQWWREESRSYGTRYSSSIISSFFFISLVQGSCCLSSQTTALDLCSSWVSCNPFGAAGTGNKEALGLMNQWRMTPVTMRGRADWEPALWSWWPVHPWLCADVPVSDIPRRASVCGWSAAKAGHTIGGFYMRVGCAGWGSMGWPGGRVTRGLLLRIGLVMLGEICQFFLYENIW